MSGQVIKNCPYCGGVAKVSFVKLSSLYVVECSHCVNKGWYAPTRNLAIKSWNERAEIQEVQYGH